MYDFNLTFTLWLYDILRFVFNSLDYFLKIVIVTIKTQVLLIDEFLFNILNITYILGILFL